MSSDEEESVIRESPSGVVDRGESRLDDPARDLAFVLSADDPAGVMHRANADRVASGEEESKCLEILFVGMVSRPCRAGCCSRSPAF